MFDDVSEETLYAAAWARVPRVGATRLPALRAYFGGWRAAWEAPPDALRKAAGLYPRELAAAVEGRGRLDPVALHAGDRRDGFQIVGPADATWPEALDHLDDPPPVLWVAGRWPPPARAVAIIGSRAASPYGERTALRLAKELAAVEVAVVSGLAEGIDRAAHEGALAVAGGWTVGVLGCGLRHVYPAHHRGLYGAVRRRGTLVSEFHPDEAPNQGAFPRRNRIIAALARGLVVVEARMRSGTSGTVAHALQLGRDVFAVPGPIDAPGSEGPHQLIRDGATLARTTADVLAGCGWGSLVEAAPPPVPLAPREAALLAALGRETLDLDRLAGRVGLDAAAAGAAMVGLELAGLVRTLPGARYVRC